MAGEFGHVCYDPAGPLCGCGRRGCWEVFASSTAALRYFAEATGKPATIDYPELCRRALAGDAAATKAVQRQATFVGRGLRMVTASLSPEAILFAGEITFAWPLVEPVLSRECEANLLAGDCPRLLCTGDGEVAHLLGAAAVVLQRHSGYYRSRTAHRSAEDAPAKSATRPRSSNRRKPATKDRYPESSAPEGILVTP
jgi:predicted NBD/HSP70 family sugar kinase